ncbi:hypothetical protein B566_EDAN004264 [Ephemera danica]|nr:hypothetical protein B566_EDAN004264 [Ephemera danica]
MCRTKQFLNRRRVYLEHDELKAAASDDDQEEEEEDEDWEEESSRMSDIPPSPPRSATPKHQQPSWTAPTSRDINIDTPRRSRSCSAGGEISGETARATVSKLTNGAVTLFVLWLSVTVDWHLGAAVLAFLLLRKLYLAAKAKVQQLTGWGGFKRKERSPAPLPIAAPPTPPPPEPSTPPPTPQDMLQDDYSYGDELDISEGDMLDDIEEEEEEYDDEEDYSEEHSIPYKYN